MDMNDRGGMWEGGGGQDGVEWGGGNGTTVIINKYIKKIDKIQKKRKRKNNDPDTWELYKNVMTVSISSFIAHTMFIHLYTGWLMVDLQL